MSEISESTALAFKLPHKKAQQYALDLHRRCAACSNNGDVDKTDIPKELQHEDILSAWIFEVEPNGKHGLFITAMEGCEWDDALCKFIQHLLRKFDPSGFVQFEWSRVCSAAEPTCFSGGAAHITATKVRLMTTMDWLTRHAKKEKGQHVDRTYTCLEEPVPVNPLQIPYEARLAGC